MNKILVIGAHYDDAELAAGGSMAKWVNEGKEVFKLTLSDNDTNFAKRNIRIYADEALEDSKKACEVLGVIEIADFPLQGSTDLVYDKKQMQLIESFILDKKIDTILIHNMFDIQQDHVHASTISYVAGRYCDNIITYQSNKYVLPVNYYPRFFIDITGTIKRKENALNCYRGLHNRDNKLFEITINQNKIWGYECTMNDNESFAEAFDIIKYTIR